MAHALSSYRCLRHLDSALVAYHTLISDLLVLAAVALPVLCGSEDPLAEQSVGLGLQCPVVDGLGLLHLAVGPLTHLPGACQTYPYCIKG